MCICKSKESEKKERILFEKEKKMFNFNCIYYYLEQNKNIIS